MRFSTVLALVLATVSAAPAFAYYAEYDARDLADELYARTEGLKESSSYNRFRSKSSAAAAGHHGTEQGHEHEQGREHEHAGELRQSSSYNHQRPDGEHKRSVPDFELTARAIEDVLARAYIDPATGKVKIVVDNGYRNGATRNKGNGPTHEGSGSGRKGTGSGRRGTGATPGKRALAELYGEW